VTAGVFIEPVVALVVAAALAVVFPAAKAARLEPVDAMHHR
jgi:ABC-type lipoprotein release transport system permease subunit